MSIGITQWKEVAGKGLHTYQKEVEKTSDTLYYQSARYYGRKLLIDEQGKHDIGSKCLEISHTFCLQIVSMQYLGFLSGSYSAVNGGT